MSRITDLTGQRRMIFGQNPGLATTLENLNEVSNLTLVSGYGVAAKLDITSSSANDAAAGTGAKQIEIVGLDANYKLLVEDVVMNGTTIVQTTGLFLYVFSAHVCIAGTDASKANLGDIWIVRAGTGGTYSTPGVPGTLTSAWIKMPIGDGVGTSGMYCVPAGERVRVRGLTAGGRTQPGEVFVYSQTPTSTVCNALQLEFSVPVGTAGPVQLAFSADNPMVFEEKTCLIMRGLSSTAGGTISAVLDLEWVR